MGQQRIDLRLVWAACLRPVCSSGCWVAMLASPLLCHMIKPLFCTEYGVVALNSWPFCVLLIVVGEGGCLCGVSQYQVAMREEHCCVRPVALVQLEQGPCLLRNQAIGQSSRSVRDAHVATEDELEYYQMLQEAQMSCI